MEFLEKHIRSLMVGFIGLIVVGVVWVFIANRTKHQETAAQEKFATIEAQYTKYKEDFIKSEQQVNKPKNTKDAAKVTAEEKKAEMDLAATLVSAKPKLVIDLTQFVDENSKTIAGSMAALYLSELLIADKKTSEALTVLKKVETTSKDLTSILVQKKLGALLADNNQCDEALKVWDKILKINTAKFAHAEVKIMQSLCYQKNNDLAKAEEILNSIKNDKTEVSAEYVQHAEKILRLINFKKASGT